MTLAIPGLPAGLRVCPPVPAFPEDPHGDEYRAAFFDWQAGVVEYRRQRWLECDVRDDKGRLLDGATGKPLVDNRARVHPDDALQQRALEIASSAADPAYFRAVWLATNETRGGWGRRKGWQPAIPYPFQVRMIRWLEERRRLAEEADDATVGLVSKPRGVGATGVLCDWNLWGWMFLESFFVKMISRNSDLVDSKSLDSLFSRMTCHVDWKHGSPAGNPLALPRWFWPEGFDPPTHKTEMLLANPANGNEVNGESTTSTAGRGGRATVGEVDEAAVIEGLVLLINAMAETVGLMILLSSETDEKSLEFGELVDAAKERRDGTLLEIDWWEHPLMTPAWERSRRADAERRGSVDGHMREVWRRRGEGLSDRAYPMWRNVEPGDYPYDGGVLDASIDPGKRDACVVGLWTRPVGREHYVHLDAMSTKRKTPQYVASVLAGYEDPTFEYEDRDLAFLRYVASLPPIRHLYGDPYGWTANTEKKDSWYDKFYLYWAEKIDEIRAARGESWEPPAILVNWSNDARGHAGRREAVFEVFIHPGIKVNATDGARETNIAMKRSQWNPPTRSRLTEQDKMPHDVYSHHRSMVEYFCYGALTWDVGGADQGNQRDPRVTAED